MGQGDPFGKQVEEKRFVKIVPAAAGQVFVYACAKADCIENFVPHIRNRTGYRYRTCGPVNGVFKSKLDLDLRPGRHAWTQVIRGEVSLNGNSAPPTGSHWVTVLETVQGGTDEGLHHTDADTAGEQLLCLPW